LTSPFESDELLREALVRGAVGLDAMLDEAFAVTR
jgi:hypothetical protein